MIIVGQEKDIIIDFNNIESIEIEICKEKDINCITCSNSCYMLNSIDIEVIKYFDGLKKEDKQ